MNELQIKLTKLIGKKELSFGCEVIISMQNFILVDSRKYWFKHSARVIWADEDNEWYNYDLTVKKQDIEIIWHPAQLHDLHRWMNEKKIYFVMRPERIDTSKKEFSVIPYNSSLPLLEQSEETLQQIINLITN